jgi:hypothetical protein
MQLSATRCSYIAILWVNLVSFAAITLCVASQRVFIIIIIIIIIVISLWLSPETFGYILVLSPECILRDLHASLGLDIHILHFQRYPH